MNLFAQLKVIGDAFASLEKDFGERRQYVFFPEPSGMLPFAVTDNGDYLYWKTSGDPDSWDVVVAAAREPQYETFSELSTIATETKALIPLSSAGRGLVNVIGNPLTGGAIAVGVNQLEGKYDGLNTEDAWIARTVDAAFGTGIGAVSDLAGGAAGVGATPFVTPENPLYPLGTWIGGTVYKITP